MNNDNSITIQWSVDNSTGIANSFKVHLKFEDTIYEVADGCEQEVRKDQIIETKEARLELSNLEAFSKYSLKVIAENDYGVSDFSKKHLFTTKPSNASSPRDISVFSFKPKERDEFGVIADLRWKAPCKLNGIFSFYITKLKESRVGYPDLSVTEASSFRNLTIPYLKRGFSYEVRVQAVTSGFTTGEFGKFIFVAPSGSEFDFIDF